jgi:hypothetical protein
MFSVNCHVRGSENPCDFTEHECDLPKVNVWCALMKNRVKGAFIFEEPMVTCDTFLVAMGNTALHPIPAGTICQLDGATPHFSMFMTFWTGSFLIIRQEEGDPFPGPIIIQIWLLWIFSSGDL